MSDLLEVRRTDADGRGPGGGVTRSADTSHADAVEARRADGPLTFAAWLCLVAVIPPYLDVVDSGPWTLEVAVLAAFILGTGYLARRRRLPAVAVSLLNLLVWTLFLVFAFFRETALVWFIPTPDTVDAVRAALAGAASEIQNSAAPVTAGAAMSFLLVASMGLLAIVIDHVVLTARMPLLAAVGLIAVTLVPPFVVPGDVDVPAFVFLAGAILLLVRAETRGRHRVDAPLTAGPRMRSVSGAAFAVGAVAIVVALVVTPALPKPTATAFIPGATTTISTNLALGEDLRRPRVVQVLLERTSVPDAPYLRVATLTRFEDAVWRSDRLRGVSIEQGDALGVVQVDSEVVVEETTTSVQIVNLASANLPVTSPAVAVDGLQGPGWTGVSYNRTVVSEEDDSQGQTYTVTARVPRPTLDQIRARSAGGGGLPDEATALPADLPSIIGELAQQVTAGAGTDYDRLVALQTWFRGPDYEYSLEAPVEEGFDGSGAEAVAEFLTRREGYCVHFASAFALMARTLGMPSRVVVGYLPGQPTTDTVDGQTVYSVVSSQLHAWPEVYFEGVGWVPFEPTKSLGVATAFSSVAGSSSSSDADASAEPTPSASARPDIETIAPLETTGPTDAAGAGRFDPLPGLWVLGAVVLALLVPALVRAVQSRSALARARRGSAAAAWLETRAVALDLGVDVSPSDSPRALGSRLVAAGAPPGAVSTVVSAIERVSYAPSPPPASHAPLWRMLLHPDDFPRDDVLADAVLAIRHGVAAEAGRLATLRAVLAPRSLVARPNARPAPVED